MIGWELGFGIGALLLLGALAWGYWRYRTRNRALDPARDAATREVYRQPDAERPPRP